MQSNLFSAEKSRISRTATLPADHPRLLDLAGELKHPSMIDHIEPCGLFIHESALPGERRADDVYPAHPNGIVLARGRFLVLYATRGWRGVDDDRSICYQLRRDSYDGPILREGMFAASINDWDALGDGRKFVRQHGHPVAFGVPRGALIGGKSVAHANVFAVKWRVVGLALSPDGQSIIRDRELEQQTQGVQWLQFRLNDRGDDLEILQPVQALRQRGYEAGPRYCALPGETIQPGHMNQTFVQAVPFNADASEWVDVNHFEGGMTPSAGIAALKYRFDHAAGIYQWVQTGPALRHGALGLGEASIMRSAAGWRVAARCDKGIAWFACDDPFAGSVRCGMSDFSPNSPHSAYQCPDGVLRLVTGNPAISPHRNARDPLYLFDVDPESFATMGRAVVLDSVAAGLPIRVGSVPRVDMGHLLPHLGGKTQFLLHRVRTKAVQNSRYVGQAVNDAEKNCSGIYLAKVHYQRELPGMWTWA